LPQSVVVAFQKNRLKIWTLILILIYAF